MQKQINSKSQKCFPGGFLATMLCTLVFFTLLTILMLNPRVSYPQFAFNSASSNTSKAQVVLPYSLHNQIYHLQTQVGVLLEQLHTQIPETKAISKFSGQVLSIALSLDKLADSLSGYDSNPPPSINQTSSSTDEDFSEAEESQNEGEPVQRKPFNSAELHNYTTPKSNRISGKKNFLGQEAVNPSIGLGCEGMASSIDRFMTYKINGLCPDDWDLAQKLIVGGCEPLPRRRCFSRTPQHYTKPLPLNSSLWTQSGNSNILWNHYKCKDYSCLVSNDNRGFYKCADCFNLSKRGWEVEVPANESASAEFTIDEVLRLKPGEIRIGLDFSPTTGTFAAIMREKNVTIASVTLNLGAPFNEVIASRGLLPLYLSIGSRLPFFDNTLDIVHSTLFLDGWIGFELLQFVLFDWDRVLRPMGLLWVDRFFCEEDEMNLYLDEFRKLGYRELMWRVVPKTDNKDGKEMFFSALLEKPTRG